MISAIKLSCVCIYTGRFARLQESLAAWQGQDFDGERELIILNAQPRQRLKCDMAGVRILTAPRPMMAPQARNFCIEQSRGDIIVAWQEDDIALPNHLKNIADAIAGNAWIYFESEFLMERGEIKKVVQSGPTSFVFTKEAWQKIGKYGAGVNGASDRNFIGKVTSQFKGEKVALNPKQISFIRCGGEAEKRAATRMVTAGDVVLTPDADKDYPALVSQFFGVKAEKKIGIVMLGRSGDIISALPFVKLVSEKYAKPDLLVAREFIGLLDGITYANGIVAAEKEESLLDAVNKSKREHSITIVAQCWGKGWTQIKKTECYNKDSWNNFGLLHRFYDPALKPVFDNRDLAREKVFIDSLNLDSRPIALVNLTSGKSSPCIHCGNLFPMVMEKFRKGWQIINIAELKAERLYDFIGLFEISDILLTIDTSFAHLSGATDIKVIALVNPTPWAATAVRFNCLEHIPYDAAKERLPLALDKFLIDFRRTLPQRIGNEIASPKMSPVPA